MPGNVGIGGSPAAWGSCIAYVIASMPVCGNFLSIAEGESGAWLSEPSAGKDVFVLDSHAVPFVKALFVLCR